MITININDPDLEKRIADKAHSTGKNIHEIAAELLSNAVAEKSIVQNYDALDPKEYGYYITASDESISANENQEQFSRH